MSPPILRRSDAAADISQQLQGADWQGKAWKVGGTFTSFYAIAPLWSNGNH